MGPRKSALNVPLRAPLEADSPPQIHFRERGEMGV
jgi:hypothetical protein